MEGELGCAAWFPHPWEGRDLGFPPLALQARNCSTKPFFTPEAPNPGQTGDPRGKRWLPLLAGLLFPFILLEGELEEDALPL